MKKKSEAEGFVLTPETIHEWDGLETAFSMQSTWSLRYDCEEIERAYMSFSSTISTRVGYTAMFVLFAVAPTAVFWTVPFIANFPWTIVWNAHLIQSILNSFWGLLAYFLTVKNVLGLPDWRAASIFERIVVLGITVDFIALVGEPLRDQCMTWASTLDDTRMVFRCQSFLHVFCVHAAYPIMISVRSYTLVPACLAVAVFAVLSRLIATPGSTPEFWIRVSHQIFCCVCGAVVARFMDYRNRYRFEVHTLAKAYAYRSTRNRAFVTATLQATLPDHALQDLLQRGVSLKETQPTMYVCELCDFVSVVNAVGVGAAAGFVARVHSELDEMVAQRRLVKYGVTGDRYACGTPLVPAVNLSDEPCDVVELGLQQTDFLAALRAEWEASSSSPAAASGSLATPSVHAFIHTGSVVGVAVGTRRVTYELLGPAMALATGTVRYVPAGRVGVGLATAMKIGIDDAGAAQGILEECGAVANVAAGDEVTTALYLLTEGLTLESYREWLAALPEDQLTPMDMPTSRTKPGDRAARMKLFSENTEALEGGKGGEDSPEAIRAKLLQQRTRSHATTVHDATMGRLTLGPEPESLLAHPKARTHLTVSTARVSRHRFLDEEIEGVFWRHAQRDTERMTLPTLFAGSWFAVLLAMAVADWVHAGRGSVLGFAVMSVGVLVLAAVGVVGAARPAPVAFGGVTSKRPADVARNLFNQWWDVVGLFAGIGAFYLGLLVHGDSIPTISVTYLGFIVWPALLYNGARRPWVLTVLVLVLGMNVPVSYMVETIGDFDAAYVHFWLVIILLAVRASSQEREQRAIFAELVKGAMDAKESCEQLAAHRALLEMLLPAQHIDAAISVVKTGESYTERVDSAAAVVIRLDGFFAAMTDEMSDIDAKSEVVSKIFMVLEDALDACRHLHRLSGLSDTMVFVSVAGSVQGSIDECLGLLEPLLREFGGSLSAIATVGPVVVTIAGRGGTVRFNVIGSALRQASETLDVAPPAFVGALPDLVKADKRRVERFGPEFELQGGGERESIVTHPLRQSLGEEAALALRNRLHVHQRWNFDVSKFASIAGSVKMTDRSSISNSSSSGESELVSFRRGKLVGRGAFGSVYLGTDMRTGKLLAAKEMRFTGDALSDETMLLSLRAEIAAMKRLSHKNVVKYMGAEKDGTTFYILMEYVAGGSLETIIKTFGALSLALAARYARQMAEGLRYVHGEGVLHRDVKAANVLVDIRGVAKIADFGTAVQSAASANVAGTALWMAPEVLRKEGNTAASDVWSLGCTVMEMITGKQPFEHLGSAYTRLATIAQADGEHPELPATSNGVLQDFLLKSLQFDPERRWTAEALLEHPFLSREFMEDPANDVLIDGSAVPSSSNLGLSDTTSSHTVAARSPQSLSVQAQLAFQSFVVHQMTGTIGTVERRNGRQFDENSPDDLVDAVRAAAQGGTDSTATSPSPSLSMSTRETDVRASEVQREDGNPLSSGVATRGSAYSGLRRRAPRQPNSGEEESL